MEWFFGFLKTYPYVLLFFTVGVAVAIGRVTIKGYGLGWVAGAVVVGAGISIWASTYGIKLELNNFTKLTYGQILNEIIYWNTDRKFSSYTT